MGKAKHVFASASRARIWSRFTPSTRNLLCAGNPVDFERLCDAKEALGVVRMCDAIRLMVDKILED